MQGKPINNDQIILCQQCRMYLSEPTTAGLVVGVEGLEAEESAIKVQVKEEIEEPKEAAVICNKQERGQGLGR